MIRGAIQMIGSIFRLTYVMLYVLSVLPLPARCLRVYLLVFRG